MEYIKVKIIKVKNKINKIFKKIYKILLMNRRN